MTLSNFLSALAARVATVESRLSELPPAQGMSTEQAAQLAQAVEDIGTMKAQLADLKALIQSTTSAFAGLREAAESANVEARAARSSSAHVLAELAAVRAEIESVKDAQGDLALLERL